MRRTIALVLTVVASAAPAAAQGGGDLAVSLAPLDPDSSPQRFLVTVANHGPDDSTYPELTVALDEAQLVAHDADPQPGSRVDGVGCEAAAERLRCSWDTLEAGATLAVELQVEVTADVDDHGRLEARVDAAGTPDPNPTANNSDALLLTAAAADLAVSVEVTEAGDEAEVAIRVVHEGGRPTEATVTLDAGGAGVIDAGGCVPDDRLLACHGTFEAGADLTARVVLARPEPGADGVTITATVSASEWPDPDSSDLTASALISPRETVPGEVRRHAGLDRIATAVAVSRAGWSGGGAAHAVLARADDFADALAGAPLAARHGAPILLSLPADLSRATAEELVRLLRPSATVWLLGGEVALSARVADRVAALGFQPRRVAGRNRYATSAAIHETLGAPATVAFADGDTHADALVAGAAMASAGGAVLLTAGQRLPDETAPLAGYADVAVGQAAAHALPDAEAVAGATPAETSVLLAASWFDAPTAVGIATAEDYPDALAGAAFAARLGAPVLLTASRHLDGAVAQWLGASDTVVRADLFGGPAALSLDVEREITDLLSR